MEIAGFLICELPGASHCPGNFFGVALRGVFAGDGAMFRLVLCCTYRLAVVVRAGVWEGENIEARGCCLARGDIQLYFVIATVWGILCSRAKKKHA